METYKTGKTKPLQLLQIKQLLFVVPYWCMTFCVKICTSGRPKVNVFTLPRSCKLWVQRRTGRVLPHSAWPVSRVQRSRSVSGRSWFPSWWPMLLTPTAQNTWRSPPWRPLDTSVRTLWVSCCSLPLISTFWLIMIQNYTVVCVFRNRSSSRKVLIRFWQPSSRAWGKRSRATTSN